MRILFIGNSHTGNCDVPGTIKAMIESDGSGRRVYTETLSVAFLEDAAQQPSYMNTVRNGKWDIVVLQGLKLSNSHKYKYPHDGAVEVAKAAIKGGAKTYFFAEWPRAGWNETDYILKEYGEISKATGAEIIPICRTWDSVLANNKNANLWSQDGNHSSPLGAYLACCVIYYWISGDSHKPNYAPRDVQSEALRALDYALATYKKFGKKESDKTATGTKS